MLWSSAVKDVPCWHCSGAFSGEPGGRWEVLERDGSRAKS